VESNQPLSSFLIITSLVSDFKLSYESIEKAEILNKYFSSISNSNDENKVLPNFDCRCLNVLSDIEVCEQDVLYADDYKSVF
jgi:hypothetical protein